MSHPTYTISKNDRRNEALLYAANAVLELGKKSYAFTTSNKYKGQKDYIIERIIGTLYDRQKKVLFLDYETSNIANDKIQLTNQQACDMAVLHHASPDAVQVFLEKHALDYDFIIFNLPPVKVAAMSVAYAKLCECTLLIERYGYSNYQAYEDTLLSFKQHGICIGGVITYE